MSLKGKTLDDFTRPIEWSTDDREQWIDCEIQTLQAFLDHCWAWGRFESGPDNTNVEADNTPELVAIWIFLDGMKKIIGRQSTQALAVLNDQRETQYLAHGLYNRLLDIIGSGYDEEHQD